MVARVAAVGVASVELWEAQGSEAVGVGVLRIPRLALAS